MDQGCVVNKQKKVAAGGPELDQRPQLAQMIREFCDVGFDRGVRHRRVVEVPSVIGLGATTRADAGEQSECHAERNVIAFLPPLGHRRLKQRLCRPHVASEYGRVRDPDLLPLRQPPVARAGGTRERLLERRTRLDQQAVEEAHLPLDPQHGAEEPVVANLGGDGFALIQQGQRPDP